MTTERAGDEAANTPRAPVSPGARTRGSAGREHELQADRARAGAAVPQPAARSSQARGTVVATAVVAVAGFLAVLTVLALQLRSNPASVGLATQKPRIVILRRVYQTTVHERVIGAGGGAVGTTVRSSSASVAPAPAPASPPVSTHTS
jgi:hypothetical protein